MILPKMALQHPMMLGKIPIIFVYFVFSVSLFHLRERKRKGGKKRENQRERRVNETDRKRRRN